jgi:hypothetical protein
MTWAGATISFVELRHGPLGVNMTNEEHACFSDRCRDSLKRRFGGRPAARFGRGGAYPELKRFWEDTHGAFVTLHEADSFVAASATWRGTVRCTSCGHACAGDGVQRLSVPAADPE